MWIFVPRNVGGFGEECLAEWSTEGAGPRSQMGERENRRVGQAGSETNSTGRGEMKHVCGKKSCDSGKGVDLGAWM
jgi:hypothetical protein